ncbi:hypothetical protein O6H91_Y248300 [Diphasiastrum complanatum]|nr:hypothetical protein O6H91_Y248300 [Diphasiastrum complanatum]
MPLTLILRAFLALFSCSENMLSSLESIETFVGKSIIPLSFLNSVAHDFVSSTCFSRLEILLEVSTRSVVDDGNNVRSWPISSRSF